MDEVRKIDRCQANSFVYKAKEFIFLSCTPEEESLKYLSGNVMDHITIV